jgi:hypothetical protein
MNLSLLKEVNGQLGCAHDQLNLVTARSAHQPTIRTGVLCHGGRTAKQSQGYDDDGESAQHVISFSLFFVGIS